MAEPSEILRDFVARLMAGEGAEVEIIEPGGLEFMAPPGVQQSLKVPEFGRLGFGAEIPSDSERVSFESDWIQRLGNVLGERGRLLRRKLNVEPPPLAHPERVLQHGLILGNAVHQLLNVSPGWTRYLVCSFRYEAFSDEKRDGIVKIAINLTTSSPVDEFIPAFEAALAAGGGAAREWRGSGTGIPESWSRERLNKLIRAVLPERIRASLAPFLGGLERRLERDSARLFEYYDGLRKESSRKTRRHEGEQDPEKSAALEQTRVAAINREYQAKVGDLEQKYALKIDVAPIQTLELTMPVRRFEVIVKRRKKERRLLLDWNPIVRKLEHPLCEHSYSSASVYVVCDEALHLVSPEAHASCESCGKEYCRACHPSRCPKCR